MNQHSQKGDKTEQGTISINNRGKGFVRLESRAKLGREGDIPVQPEDIGEAFQGDLVEVRLYSGFRGIEHAQVVQIVEQKKNSFVGTLSTDPIREESFFVEPDDKRAGVIFEIKKSPELEALLHAAGFAISDIKPITDLSGKRIKVLIEKMKWLRLPEDISKSARMEKRNFERGEMDKLNDMLARGEKIPEHIDPKTGMPSKQGLDFSTTRIALGEVIKIIGEKGDNNAEMESIVLERGFDVTFPSHVIEEATEASQELSKVTDEELARRRDMRGVFTCTIDPVDAKDFDDALSIRPIIENGEELYEVGIHIADVSHFVREKTALDNEAKKRAFSVYLVDRTIPMLPSILSNGACSLNPHEDRFAFSAIFIIDKKGTIKSKWFGKTIIHSDKRFSYESAQEILTQYDSIAQLANPGATVGGNNDSNGKGAKNIITPEYAAAIEALPWFDKSLEKTDTAIDGSDANPGDTSSKLYARELLELNRIAKIYLEQKRANGAIDFETTEIKFKLDDSGKPIAVYKKARVDTHKLVEEYMLLANKEVAKYVDAHNREGGHIDPQDPNNMVGGKSRPGVFRVHDYPDPDRIQELSIFVKALGFELEINPEAGKKNGKISPKQLQKLLKDVEGSPEEAMIKIATLRSMAKAIYSIHDLGHFGLSFDHYTHFTSPIRRYPDLMIHRILEDILHGKIVPQSLASTYERICADSTRREIEAADGERASIKYKQVEYMMEKVGQEFDVTISGIAEFGMFVQEPESMAEGLIRLTSLKPDDFYTADTKSFKIVGENTKTEFHLGNTLHVRLVAANLEEKMLDFQIIS